MAPGLAIQNRVRPASGRSPESTRPRLLRRLDPEADVLPGPADIELVRYINRTRPSSSSELLLVLRDGRPVSVACVSRFFQRLRGRVGFRVHAHKFRHTFATEYLRRGGEIERLRRILGHTTYVMVMRYVHLDKGDLYRDFDRCAPF